MDERVLITGGGGFIGSHLADAWLARGAQVAILDNFSTGRRHYPPAAAQCFEGDLRDRAALEAVVASVSPTLVFHLAAQINVRVSVSHPLEDATVNIRGGLLLLEALAAAPELTRVLFASTGGAMYPESAPHPSAETDPADPSAPYGIAKLAFEEYLRVLGALRGLPVCVLRYGNVYGPRQIPEGEAGVIAIFSHKFLAGEAPAIFGTGEDSRDYVSVHDCVAANLAAADAGLTGLYNVGTGIATSVNELSATMRRLIVAEGLRASVPEPVHVPPRPGELSIGQLDAAKLKAATGWAPTIDLETGLRETLRWFASGAAR